MSDELKNFDPEKFYIKGKKRELSRFPTEIDRLYKDDEHFEKLMEKFRDIMTDRHDILYAGRQHGVLVIFQGMDASGKDGAIKHVMSGLNPEGVDVTSFGPPSTDELRHGYLWRTHCRIPARGKIGIFNRSYYEEVLTVRVHPEYLAAENLPKENSKGSKIWDDRFTDILNHERYLYNQGYRILKFFLHVSKSEQKKRLLEHINDPKKNWKFDKHDLEERDLWPKFMKYYAEALFTTSKSHAPWYLIPADDKKNARLMISAIFAEFLQDLPLELPQVTPEQKRVLNKLKHSCL